MAKCIVVADDLTGANATGVLLKKNGFVISLLKMQKLALKESKKSTLMIF